MILNHDKVARIEAATQDQSECELWFALRNGRLTSSRFGEILNQRSSIDPKRLVRDIMGYGGPMKNFPLQIHWGKKNEEKARIDNKCNIKKLRTRLPIIEASSHTSSY